MSALEDVVRDALDHKGKNVSHNGNASSRPPGSPPSRPSTRDGPQSPSMRNSSWRQAGHAGRMPSTSLDTNLDPSLEDPEAPNFVHNESAFRGPLESGGTSPRTPRSKRQNSWLGSASENEGFFRKWVEEPLGIISDEAPNTPAPNDHPISTTPRAVSESASPKPSTPNSPARTSKPVTWDSAVMNKLGRRKFTEGSQHEPGTTEEDGEPNGVIASNEGRPPAARLASRRWAIIKHRLAPAHSGSRAAGATAAVSPDVNISDELLGGGLAALMLKMHFDRDEQNKRRVPVLLHHLKIRVSDSVNPLQGTHTTFRIEVGYPRLSSTCQSFLIFVRTVRIRQRRGPLGHIPSAP